MTHTGETSGVIAHWFALDVLWGLAGGLLIGFLGGWGLGYVGTHLRHATRDVAPSDFMAIGIVVVVYALAKLVDASGFLAAFAAGVGLRRVELLLTKRSSADEAHDSDDEPAETTVNPNERSRSTPDRPGESVGWVVSDALSFGETFERLIAFSLVLAVGIAVVPVLSASGAWIAAALFVIVRPVSVWIATIGSGVPWQRRVLIGWFGIRGLGSLNYLAFALVSGFNGVDQGTLVGIVLTVVATSIIAHGVTVTPLMNWRQRVIEAKRQSR